MATLNGRIERLEAEAWRRYVADLARYYELDAD